MKKEYVIGICIGLTAVGFGSGYVTGSHFSKSAQAGAGFRQMGQGFSGARTGAGSGANNMQRERMGGGILSGEIISQDEKSVTLKMQDGGSKIVLISGSTQFKKMTDAQPADFTVGQSVMVTGSTNNDGSVTASQIQLRPVMQAPVAK